MEGMNELIMDMSLAEGGSNYDMALMEDFVRLIAEYLGVAHSEIRARVDQEFRQHAGSIVSEAWNQARPQNPSDVVRFYQETDSYIYDLAVDHCHIRRTRFRDVLTRRIERRGNGQKVLLYGDGIGTDSIMLARRGHLVTYFDLPGKTSDFARFRFKREGLDQQIKAVEQASDIPAEVYDVVICVEVLEHVVDPLGVMKNLYRALRPGGIALITESFECVGEEYPSHLPENFRYAGKTHSMMEGLGFANTYNHLDPINCPMEFIKAQPNHFGGLQRLQGRMARALITRLHRVRQR
jgi:2-polyprenyl-3-methyl-5-hydroxy-6-metoxy-1,4-benzoquinol methylase